MYALIKIQLIKIMKSRRFLLAIVIAIALSAIQAVLVVQNYLTDLQPMIDTLRVQDSGLSVASAYNYFLPLRNNYDVIAGVFIQAWPLFIALASSWCFIDDIESGMSDQLLMHSNKRQYIAAIYIAVAGMAAGVMIVSLLLNFVILSSWLPLSTPQISDLLYIGVIRTMPLSTLFYTHPLACVVALTCLASGISALWALLVMNVSVLVRNFNVTFIVSYIVLLFISTVGEQLRAYLLSLGNELLARSALVQLDVFTVVAATSKPQQALFITAFVLFLIVAICITSLYVTRRGVTRNA